MQHPLMVGIISSLVVAVPTVIIFLWKLRDKSTEHMVSRIDALEDEKRGKDDCRRFRERIGRESDQHADSYREIREALIFLVTKLGGDPSDLGMIRR